MNHNKLIIKSCFALLVLLAGSYFINNERKILEKTNAAVINDSFVGDKIIDIALDSRGFSFFAINEKREIYGWGDNQEGSAGLPKEIVSSDSPQKIICRDEECGEGSNFIINKIFLGHSQTYATSNNNVLYGWGSNSNNSLGLGISDRAAFEPTKITYENDNVIYAKHISSNHALNNNTFLVDNNGKLYASGSNEKKIFGIGNSSFSNYTVFNNIPTDKEGNELVNIKSVKHTNILSIILLEDGTLMRSGNATKNNYPNQGTNKFTKFVYEDGSIVNDIDKILFVGSLNCDIVALDKEGHIVYTSYYIGGLESSEKGQMFKKIDDQITSSYKLSDFSFYEQIGDVITFVKDGKPYYLEDFRLQEDGNFLDPKSYFENEITSEFSYAKKFLRMKGQNIKTVSMILTENGAVYVDGIKVGFGDIIITGNKTNGSGNYQSSDKYNDDIELYIDTSSSKYEGNVKFIETDLLNHESKEPQDKPDTNMLTLTVPENTRIFKQYEFYLEGFEDKTKATFIVDLYKEKPSLTGLMNGSKYKPGKSFALPGNWNTYTAMIQKDMGIATNYASGTPINDEGDYIITLKDAYGNEKAYNFTITSADTAESIVFTKSGNLIFGDTSTSANNQIGTLSLKYAEGATKAGTLKTAVLGTGGNEDKFLIDPTDNKKLKAKVNLNAGTYTLHISGLDTNDIPYDGTIEIVVAPVDQSSGDNKFDFDTSFSSGEMFYGDTLDLSSIITGGASSITPTFTVSEDTGTGAVVNNGKITPTNIGTFKLEATKEDPNGNYAEATISKTVRVKPKPITISVKTPLTKKAGAVLPTVGDNYDVIPALINGDTLTGTPEYEYVGSSDNNSTDNVKVKIKGLSNSKYTITFSESDVTVEQDTAGTEGTDYEITGTKGNGDWYISDVAFKLLQPAINSGYNLFSNTNNFTTDNFIISDEGDNSVTFRMKNGTTGALTATETKKIKIDKTAPNFVKIDYAEKGGNNKSPVTGKPFDYYFVHGTDIKIEASDITSGIASYEMIATPLQDDGTIDSTKSKITDKKDSTNNTYKFTINQQGNYEIEVKAYDAAGNSVGSTKVKVKINENVGELTAKANINNDASKPYDGSKWTNQKINFTLNCTNASGVSDYYWSNDGGATYTKMSDNKLEIPNTSTINNVEYSFKAMTHDGNELTATLPVKIDVTKPEVTNIQYTQKMRSTLQSFLNAVSFDHYFKEAQTATFQGKDEESGIDTFEYSITKIDKNQNPIGNADKGTGSTYELEMDKNYKVELYALDKAGNKSDVVYSETVSIDSSLGDLALEAYVNNDTDRPYDGTKWVHESIAVHLSVKGDVTIDEYSYSINGKDFTACPSNVCTIPSTSNINNKEYTFQSKDSDGNVSKERLNIKIDTETPLLYVKGKVGNEDYSESSEAGSDITLSVDKGNENISGVTYFYTKDVTVSTTEPSLINGWKEYKNPIVISTNGTSTYYFAGVSGAGKASTVTSYDTNLVKKTYDDIVVKAVSNGKNYVSGEWTNDDVTFTLSGGIEDTLLIQTYQYTETTGAAPDASSIWKNVSGTSQHVVSGNTNKTYWFRVVPIDPKGTISKGYSVKIDKVNPSDVTFKTKSVAKGVLNSITDLLTTGDWSNSALQVEMEADDHESGVKEIKYIETKNGTPGTQKVYTEPLIYKEDGIVSFKATAYDEAGNTSDNESISDTYKIDLTAPLIHGAEDEKTYYYVTRYITYDDGNGSGVKDALVSFNNGAFTTLNNGHKLSDEGDYTLKVSDEAGNVHEINFKIVGLPDMDDIDGSDESRDIIDQVIDEYEEVKDELTEEEKKEIEDWIDEAEKKWEDARKKVVEDKDSGATVEGLDDVTFDPNTELVVKEDGSVKDKDISKVPGIDKNDEIKEGFDVKLIKGDTVINPDGSVVVRIPIRNEYKYTSMKVVMIDDKGDISFVNAEVKNGYVEFVTDKPNNKFAFVGPKEKDPNVDVDVDDDGKPDINIDTDGDGDADINIDTDGDKLPDVNIDIDGDKKADINIDVDGDGIPDINIDTDGDGKPDYNIDIDGDGKPDVNIGPVKKPWKPDLCVDYNKDGKKDWCTSTYKKPYLNIDTDSDGRPDINLDLDGDNSADINIDTNGDNIPDLNIDTSGDGKANINIDINNDGFADVNLKKLTKWTPDKDVDGAIKYDTMSGIVPDTNIDTDGDGKPDKNLVDKDGNTINSNDQQTSVKGQTNTKRALGGAGTGDQTKLGLLWMLSILSFCVMLYTGYKRYHEKYTE